jgi:hypothetical protein
VFELSARRADISWTVRHVRPLSDDTSPRQTNASRVMFENVQRSVLPWSSAPS